MSELFYVPTDGPPESVLICTGTRSKYAHRFSGKAAHKGTTFPGCTRPLTLLYTFDLADPHFRLEIPGIRRLPLYNGMCYDSSPVYYRIKSNAEIEILRQDLTTFTPDFPYDNYPQSFPELPVSLVDPEPIFDDPGIRNTWELIASTPEEKTRSLSKSELIQCFGGIWRDSLHTCINPTCRASDVNYLAAFDGEWLKEKGISIWGGFEDVVIIYHICYSCYTISTFNLAT